MCTTLKAWQLGLHFETIPPNSASPHTPMWLNPSLPHLYTLPDLHVLVRYKIKNTLLRTVNCSLSLILEIKINPLQYTFRY